LTRRHVGSDGVAASTARKAATRRRDLASAAPAFAKRRVKLSAEVEKVRVLPLESSREDDRMIARAVRKRLRDGAAAEKNILRL
jgi:hypothetical protein